MNSQCIVYLEVGGKLVKCLVEDNVADTFYEIDRQLKQANRMGLVKGASIITRKRTNYAAEVVKLGLYREWH